MIVLIFDPTSLLSDFLNINVITPTAGGAISWYCTWGTTPPLVPLPYGRKFGLVTGPSVTAMTPAIPANFEIDIRELAIHNSRGEPVQIGIEISNGANISRLMDFGLGADHTLTYNAMPITGGAGWKLFDGEGHLISQG